MVTMFRGLFSSRIMIQTLVARDLKACYRGSTLGLLWTWLSPLLYMASHAIVSPSMSRHFWFFCPLSSTQLRKSLRGFTLLCPYPRYPLCGCLPGCFFVQSARFVERQSEP